MGIFGDLVCCICLVQNNHRQNMIGSAADPAIDVVLNLTVQDSGIRTLSCQDQVDTKGSSLSGNRAKQAFNLN